jgi:hypothetical protein
MASTASVVFETAFILCIPQTFIGKGEAGASQAGAPPATSPDAALQRRGHLTRCLPNIKAWTTQGTAC